MIKVAVLGLTGDPVTLGHMELAKVIAQSGLVDVVWVQPCWKHRLGKEPVDAVHRLEMVRIGCFAWRFKNTANEVNIIPSAFEIDNKFEGGTYLLHQTMKSKFPEHQFFHVIGMDNANNIDKWTNPEKLKAEVPFIVCDRHGVDEKETWFNQPPHKRLHHKMKFPVSSTLVRELIKTQDSGVLKYVHTAVHQYIEINGLYS